MTRDRERLLTRQVGQKIAAVRRARRITQGKLGAQLGLTQSMIASYEIGRRRMPLSRLFSLAEALGVSSVELLADTAAPTQPGKRGPKSRLEAQIEQVRRLPREQQKAITTVLDMALKNASQAGG
jgi:transcriptional regulator with XRE-family HTH domain